MTRDRAETIALEALAWVAGNDELMPVFLGSTGAGADGLRSAARDPEFLGAVLDFLVMDDAWVVAFCDHAGLGYDSPLRARQELPGGGLPNWT